MLIKVYREFDTGGLDTITIEWERRRRTWRTANVMWTAEDIPVFSEQELECDKYSYNEEKTYREDKVIIKRTWIFYTDDGMIIAREDY